MSETNGTRYPTWEIIAGVFGTISLALVALIYTSHASLDDSRFLSVSTQEKNSSDQIDAMRSDLSKVKTDVAFIRGALEAKGLKPLVDVNTTNSQAVNDK